MTQGVFQREHKLGELITMTRDRKIRLLVIIFYNIHIIKFGTHYFLCFDKI